MVQYPAGHLDTGQAPGVLRTSTERQVTRDVPDTTLEKLWRFIEQSQSQLNMVSHLLQSSLFQERWVVLGFPHGTVSQCPASLPTAPFRGPQPSRRSRVEPVKISKQLLLSPNGGSRALIHHQNLKPKYDRICRRKHQQQVLTGCRVELHSLSLSHCLSLDKHATASRLHAGRSVTGRTEGESWC